MSNRAATNQRLATALGLSKMANGYYSLADVPEYSPFRGLPDFCGDRRLLPMVLELLTTDVMQYTFQNAIDAKVKAIVKKEAHKQYLTALMLPLETVMECVLEAIGSRNDISVVQKLDRSISEKRAKEVTEVDMQTTAEGLFGGSEE